MDGGNWRTQLQPESRSNIVNTNFLCTCRMETLTPESCVPSAVKWQEEVYQKHEFLPQPSNMDQLDKLRLFKNMLEKLMQVLQTKKNNILPTHGEKLASIETQCIGLLKTNRPKSPAPSMQPSQILPPQMQSIQQPPKRPRLSVPSIQSDQILPQKQSMQQRHSHTSQQLQTPHNGVPSVGEWQEEVHRKIKNMKDMYFADLNEMYQKICIKLQQQESLPQPPKINQLDKLRLFKNIVEKLMQVLQTKKNGILPTHREKLPSFEKQIISVLNTNRPRRPTPFMQPGQILSPQMQSTQQPYSQTSQPRPHDVCVIPLLQTTINLPGSIAPVQQSNEPSSQQL